MRLLFCLLSLCLLLPTAGCRDAVVDPLPDETAPGVAPPSDSGDFYLKGAGALVIGQQSEFRTEPNPETERYAWYFEGEALLELSSTTSRVTLTTARAYGSTTLVVVHYDAAGRQLGRGRKQVVVAPD